MIHENAGVLVRMENMSKYREYGSVKAEAVSIPELRIMQGEFISVEGLRGERKNAFMKVLGCLARPDAGKYYFDYEDIALAGEDILGGIRKNKIGYLFREHKLIKELTAAENIYIPMHGLNISKQEKRDRMIKALASMGMEKHAGEKVSALAGFERQLVSLARAIVNSPLMLIADEPAANLDSCEEEKLMEQLFRLNNEGIAIILNAPRSVLKGFLGYRSIAFHDGMLSKGGAV